MAKSNNIMKDRSSPYPNLFFFVKLVDQVWFMVPLSISLSGFWVGGGGFRIGIVKLRKKKTKMIFT